MPCPQLWNHQFWKRGVLARRGREERINPQSVSVFCACASCGKEVSASHLFFPSRALEQDEVIKAGANASSQSYYFASCTPRCCCLLHQASLTRIPNTSIRAHVVLLMIHQFFALHDSVSSTKDANIKKKITLLGVEYIFQTLCG